MRLRPTAVAGALAALSVTSPPADTAIISGTADVDDATLIETDVTGNTGADPACRVGRTGQPSIRRMVLRFDLGVIAPGATINSVELDLNVGLSSSGSDTLRIHRLTNSWVEGTGVGVGGSQGGQAGQLVPGAVTWNSREHGTSLWTTPGGDFVPAESASVLAPGSGGFSFSGAGLVADVQGWVNSPASNFGWIIRGTESVQSARIINASESPQGPVLTVDFTPGTTAAEGWPLYR
ncbi:MAG: hypothetical protein HUU25_13410 [Candidatus Sumerlaeia bacterium]|nr:hypothetical protein [Candidatus Sumerlaeia bacterium]